ncbi:hypothetical protein AVEN_27378-1 [Araneus ventricosus]|uniref:Uncharacterized protein n=1 Tax=Araneus ventricosus TaxID=182803 RepID=A0A4Y2JTH8_ARAVE|nr:hypothetical protein AVEN_27378-1 [Araneus ventricosus]
MTFPPHASLLESGTWGRNECHRDDESTVSHPYIRTEQHVFVFITPKDIFSLFLGPVLVRLRPFHTRFAILRRDHGFLEGASFIQSSCLKPTPDSTNRGFWRSQNSRAISTAVRRGLTCERRKTFLSKRRDVERGHPDLGTFGTPP